MMKRGYHGAMISVRLQKCPAYYIFGHLGSKCMHSQVFVSRREIGIIYGPLGNQREVQVSTIIIR